MKKWTFVYMTLLLCAALTLSVSAAESDALPDGYFATSSDLYQYWNSTYPPQYPDYLAGTWTDNGTAYPLTFALTDDAAGKAGEREILRLLADDGSVKFTKAKYSYNLLMQIMGEIQPYFEHGIGLVSLGVFDMDNCVGLEIHTDHKDADETRAFLRDLKARYGDAVRITYTDGYVTYTMDIDSSLSGETGKVQGKMLPIFFAVGIGLLGTAALAATLYHRRRVLVAQTPSGTVTADVSHKLTRRETEKVLRESGEVPPATLEKRVEDRIDRESR